MTPFLSQSNRGDLPLAEISTADGVRCRLRRWITVYVRLLTLAGLAAPEDFSSPSTICSWKLVKKNSFIGDERS